MMVTQSARARPSRASLLLRLGAMASCFVAPYHAFATSVTNCEDSGAGSLRQALIDTPDGGTIDATGLANVCSVITVKTGELSFGADDLTIIGPGADKLFISALLVTAHGFHHYESRIFSHTGRGTFALKNLSLQSGLVTTTSTSLISGGCIESTNAAATLSLDGVNVDYCRLDTAGQGSGGAISAAGAVYLHDSHVYSNSITGTIYTGIGGAISANHVTLRDASITGNSVSGGTGMSSVVNGGGISAGSVDISGSTVSGNTATGGKLTHYGNQSSNGGGIYSRGIVTISDSTVSGNSSGYGAGLAVNGTTVSITNSTIAFNTSSGSHTSGNTLLASTSLNLDSTIFSNNRAGSLANDLVISGPVSASGTHNLVFASSSALPAGTLRYACALLAPLADNGGTAMTHALWSHSPAIGTGNNSLNLPFDQRGSGFPRTSGTGTDIGSFEVQVNDELFGSGFDGC